MRNFCLRLLPLVCLLGLIGLPMVSLAQVTQPSQEMQPVEMEQALPKPALHRMSAAKAASIPDFTAYVARLQSRIRNNWHPPAYRAKQPLRIVARFRVDRDGTLSELALTTPAQEPEQNQAALQASPGFRTV